jgi:hypothetical protein
MGRKVGRPTARGMASDALTAIVARRDQLFAEVYSEAVAAMPEECRVDHVDEPVDAVPCLDAVRLAIETLGEQYAQAMGIYSWLFWLRRLPPTVFSGDLATSRPYRQALAEVLSARTTHAEYFGSSKARVVFPPVTDSQMESLMKLCGIATALATIHSVIRRAGKGQRVQWFGKRLPWVVPDPALDEMIDLYDHRNLTGGLRAGTRSFKFYPLFTEIEPSYEGAVALVVNHLREIAPVPYWRGPARAVTQSDIRQGRYIAGAMTATDIRNLLQLSAITPTWNDPGLASLLIFLRILFLVIFESGWGPEWNPLPSVGYLVIPSEGLTEIMQRLLPVVSVDLAQLLPGAVPENAQQVLADVANLEASSWPLIRGSIIRWAGDQVAIDVDAASDRLDRMLTIPNRLGGNFVNARATHFEHHVQEQIDRTPWVPELPLRALWSRTLRINRTDITDIDAMAVRGSTILFVSCKSILYTPEYDGGDYNSVRNVRTNLEEYDVEWQARISVLRNSPIGDNYDLTGYELYGVVCTPHVSFVHKQQARVVISCGERHLRATCTAYELRDFLEATDDISGAL